jgi:hypothetical protein
MENEINSIKLNQQFISTKRKPDFGIMYEHITKFNGPDVFFISGKMTIPIAPWSAKEYQYSIKSMDFEVEAMQKKKEDMLNMASRMVSETIYHLITESQILTEYTSNAIPDLKKGLDVTISAYEQNTAELIEVLDIWESYYFMRMEYLEHLKETLLLVVDYEREIEKK